MQEWEYKVEKDLEVPQMNQYGRDGWELVAVSDKLETTYFFKRPLDAENPEFVGVMPETGFTR